MCLHIVYFCNCCTILSISQIWYIKLHYATIFSLSTLFCCSCFESKITTTNYLHKSGKFFRAHLKISFDQNTSNNLLSAVVIIKHASIFCTVCIILLQYNSVKLVFCFKLYPFMLNAETTFLIHDYIKRHKI